MKNVIYNTLVSTALLCCVSCTGEDAIAILEGLEISPDNVSIVKGESKQLELLYTPEDFMAGAAVWTSSNESIATVSQEGVVSALECGEVVITAVSSGVMAKCNVAVVSSVVESISLSASELDLFPQESASLSVTSSPEDADLSALVWASSDESVAVVDQNGTIMAIAAGNADITASVGEISATCKVTVKNKAKVGDFFYSDGTWSTTLDESKTVVGVVFYSGNPSVDDKILSEECPGCVNGLAVSLTESTSVFHPEFSKFYSNSGYSNISDWGADNMPGYEILETSQSRGDNGNFMLGYNNTKVLIAFNEDPANSEWKLPTIEELEKFAETNTLPDNTSGWYLPSIKELYILRDGPNDNNIFWVTPTFSNITVINNSLAKVNGAQLLGEGADKEYWASTAYNKDGWMCFLDFKITSVPSGQPAAYSTNSNRFVFAF